LARLRRAASLGRRRGSLGESTRLAKASCVSNLAVLLVEDREDDVELTLRAFRKAKIANPIIVKENAFATLEYLNDPNEPPPEIILLDINLPGMSGLDLLKRLRQLPKTKRTPVIMMTSSTQDEDVLHAYDDGANSYIRKPINTAEFNDVVGQLGMYWLVTNTPPLT
jgi:two-component system response regulator